jgi:acylphosphatase
MAERIRRVVWFAGRVQGVGFRDTTCEVATGFSVTGTVRNLADGRVEVVAEGDPGEIDRFVGAVEASMGRYVRDVVHEDRPATGEFAGFRVAF